MTWIEGLSPGFNVLGPGILSGMVCFIGGDCSTGSFDSVF
jgi:hypothetical protein